MASWKKGQKVTVKRDLLCEHGILKPIKKGTKLVLASNVNDGDTTISVIVESTMFKRPGEERDVVRLARSVVSGS